VKNQGGRRGGPSFRGGVIAPPCRGVGATLRRPASLPAPVGLNDLRIVPSGINHAQLPVLFPRNVERDLVADENRRDLGRFLTGGWRLFGFEPFGAARGLIGLSNSFVEYGSERAEHRAHINKALRFPD
jgi:hypothetical protein